MSAAARRGLPAAAGSCVWGGSRGANGRLRAACATIAKPRRPVTELSAASGAPDAARYAYRPVSPDLDAAMARLEREHAGRPARIIQLMSANAIERVRTAALRTFADAFVPGRD